MKKVIALALTLMVVASSPGFCLMDTVDRLVVKDRVASDLRPECDEKKRAGISSRSFFLDSRPAFTLYSREWA